MAQPYVYLDYAASAPLCEAARAAEEAYEQAPYAGANPNSLHTAGRQAARALDSARRDLVRCLEGRYRPQDVTFTSGGTESNNLALLGIAEAVRDADRRRNRVVMSAIEHDSVLDVRPALEERGFEVVVVKAGADGIVDAQGLEAAMGPTTALVSLMSANNETGIIQPVGEVARHAHAVGALMHTDAVQGFCRIPLQTSEADAVSIAAHKIGGPVGVGALVTSARVRKLRPQSFGGQQERGRRAGTQDVRGALAFAAAATYCHGRLAEARSTVQARAQALYQALCTAESGIVASVDLGLVPAEERLAGIVSVLAPGLDGETLVLECDQAGFAVSAASACSSGSPEASHVLLGMGVRPDLAACSLRISFDERVAEQDLMRLAVALKEIVTRKRGHK